MCDDLSLVPAFKWVNFTRSIVAGISRHQRMWDITFCFFGVHKSFVPLGSPPRGGDVTVHVRNKTPELAHSSLSRSCICFCLHGPFNCISFHTFSRQLSAFSLCSSGLISALLRTRRPPATSTSLTFENQTTSCHVDEPNIGSRQSRALFLPPASWHLTDKDKLV